MMYLKLKMRFLVAHFLSLLPQKIALGVYQNSFTKFQKLLSTRFSANEMIAWTRNSHQLARIVPGLSDIDWTIVVLTENSSIQAISEDVNKLAQRMPFPGGEINLYRVSDLPDVFLHGNHFELRRDPHLVTKAKNLGIVVRETGNPSEAFAFLVKMFLADAHNLCRNSDYRISKWKGHFHDLGLDFELVQKDFESKSYMRILSSLSQILGSVMRLSEDEIQEVRWSLEALADARMKNLELSDEHFEFQSHPWLFVLGLNWLAYTNKEIPLLTKEQAMIGIEMVRWEIHASLSQWYHLKNFEQHLENMYRIQDKYFFPVMRGSSGG